MSNEALTDELAFKFVDSRDETEVTEAEVELVQRYFGEFIDVLLSGRKVA